MRPPPNLITPAIAAALTTISAMPRRTSRWASVPLISRSSRPSAFQSWQMSGNGRCCIRRLKGAGAVRSAWHTLQGDCNRVSAHPPPTPPQRRSFRVPLHPGIVGRRNLSASAHPPTRLRCRSDFGGCKPGNPIVQLFSGEVKIAPALSHVLLHTEDVRARCPTQGEPQ